MDFLVDIESSRKHTHCHIANNATLAALTHNARRHHAARLALERHYTADLREAVRVSVRPTAGGKPRAFIAEFGSLGWQLRDIPETHKEPEMTEPRMSAQTFLHGVNAEGRFWLAFWAIWGAVITAVVFCICMMCAVHAEVEQDMLRDAVQQGYIQKVDRGSPSTMADDEVIWVRGE